MYIISIRLVFVAALVVALEGSAHAEFPLRSKGASEIVKQKYDNAPLHKAFAQSSSGAWGYAVNQPSISAAHEVALKYCNAGIKVGDPACIVWDSDGNPVSDAEAHERQAIDQSINNFIDALLKAAVSQPFNDMVVYRTAARLAAVPYGPQANGLANSSKARKLAVQANHWIRENEFGSALPLLQQATAIAPRSGALWRALGVSWLATGHDTEAEQAFKYALRGAPWDAQAWSSLGAVLTNLGKADAAKGAVVLAFEWSQDKEKTLETFHKIANEAVNEGLRQLYSAALPYVEQRMASHQQMRREFEVERHRVSANMPDKQSERPRLRVESCKRPSYPDTSFASDVQGQVVLAFRIDAEGRANRALVVQSSGTSDLDYAAVFALFPCDFSRNALWEDAELNWATVQFDWRLK